MLNTYRTIKYFFILIFVVTASVGHCMQEEHYKKVSLETMVSDIKDQDLAEALMVRLAYKFGLNMFGRQVNDRISTIPHARGKL